MSVLGSSVAPCSLRLATLLSTGGGLPVVPDPFGPRHGGAAACDRERHRRQRSPREAAGRDPRAQFDRDFTREPRLPRNPGSLIISATKGWLATCATGF